MYFRADCRCEHRSEEADSSRTKHESALVNGKLSTPHGPKCVTAGFDKGPDRIVDGVRESVESRDRHSQLLSERTWESTANTYFEPKIADVLVVLQAPQAGATAQHGVTGDPAV